MRSRAMFLTIAQFQINSKLKTRKNTKFFRISGSHPFPQNNPEEQYYRILESKVEFPGAWKYVSPQAKNLITNLLDKDPLKRLSANQALRHPWILR